MYLELNEHDLQNIRITRSDLPRPNHPQQIFLLRHHQQRGNRKQDQQQDQRIRTQIVKNHRVQPLEVGVQQFAQNHG